MSTRHLVVISLDALSETEWDYLKDLPHMSALIANGCSSRELRSVFPTHTYTVHTSMVTGMHPDKHGIIHNHQFQPFIPDPEQNWYWYQKEIHSPTLYDLARSKGLKTAGLLWPVSGKSSLTWNFPEIMATKGENQVLKILKNGSPLYILGLVLRNYPMLKSTSQPLFDDFVSACAVDTLIRKKPDLMLVHFTDLDNSKHKYRVESPQIVQSLKRLDRRVGEIIEASKKAGIYDKTTFVLLGDHGQFSVDYNIHLNNLLRDAGLISEDKGKWNWKAYLQTTGGNAYLHSRDSRSESLALKVLNKAMINNTYGIEAIYSRAELDILRAHKSLNYVVEAKAGYHFHDELSDETIEDYKALGKDYGTHGYSPDKKGYKCLFCASGKGIVRGRDLGALEMVDIAPTLADLLDLDFYDCDGSSFADRLQGDS